MCEKSAGRGKPSDSNAYRATIRSLRCSPAEAHQVGISEIREDVLLGQLRQLVVWMRNAMMSEHRRCRALKHINTPFIRLNRDDRSHSHTGAPRGELTNLSWHLVHDNLLKRACVAAHARARAQGKCGTCASERENGGRTTTYRKRERDRM